MKDEKIIFEMEIELDPIDNYLDDLLMSGVSIEEVEDYREAIEVLKQNNPSISLDKVIEELKINVEEK